MHAIQKSLIWLKDRAGDLTSVFLGLMFMTFIVQIVFRYVLNLPLAWTLELCLTLWLWTVFWGTAFLIQDEDHVRFDIFYQSRSERGRRILSLIYSVCIIAAFGLSLPATIDYITFLKIKPSVTLGWRMDLVFSCYLIFAIGVILQYLLRIWRIVTGRPFESLSFYAASAADGGAAGLTETRT
jgi:C4-dicarboxylate transporter, DctQ subunit